MAVSMTGATQEDVLILSDRIQRIMDAGIVGGITDMVEMEDVLDALQQRVVIIGSVGRAAWLDEWGQQQRANSVAAETVDHDIFDQRGCIEQGKRAWTDTVQVWSGLLIATCLSGECDVHRLLSGAWVYAHAFRKVAFVEGDDEQSVLFIGVRCHNLRHPCFQEGVSGGEPARAAVSASSAGSASAAAIVAVVAQIRSDEDEVPRGPFLGKIVGQMIEIDDVPRAS